MCTFAHVHFQRCIEESYRSEMIMETMLSDRFFNKLSESGMKIPKKSFFEPHFWHFREKNVKFFRYFFENTKFLQGIRWARGLKPPEIVHKLFFLQNRIPKNIKNRLGESKMAAARNKKKRMNDQFFTRKGIALRKSFIEQKVLRIIRRIRVNFFRTFWEIF